MSIFTNFLCKLGDHSFVITAERIKEEKWYKKDAHWGRKIEGTDFIREKRCVVEKCSKCGKEIAWKAYDYGDCMNLLDPNYARELINDSKRDF